MSSPNGPVGTGDPRNFTPGTGVDPYEQPKSNLMEFTDGRAGFIERERREGPAWHKLGSVFGSEERLLVREAARRTRADQLNVTKSPILTVYTDPTTNERQLLVDKGRDRYYRLVRAPMEGDEQIRVFGRPVTEEYTVLSVEEMVTLLDGMRTPDGQRLTDTWPIETMGVLFHGERVFISFQSDRQIIHSFRGKTDEVQGYFIVSLSLDGMRANEICYSGVRPVCRNTLRWALATATTAVKIRHTSNAAQQMELYTRLMTGMSVMQERTIALMNELAQFQAAGDEEASRIIDAAFPLRKASSKQSVAQAILAEVGGDKTGLSIGSLDELGKDTIATLMAQHSERQAELEAFNKRQRDARAFTQDLYLRERADFPDMGALWLANNAIVEYADWMVPQRQDRVTSVADSVLDGERLAAKTRGVKASMELMAAGRR